MKKIVLNVEALAVESFVAEAEPGARRGTVQGHATLRCPNQTAYMCTLGYNTCDYASCIDTCGYPYKPAC
jgi:hypothetical protein